MLVIGLSVKPKYVLMKNEFIKAGRILPINFKERTFGVHVELAVDLAAPIVQALWEILPRLLEFFSEEVALPA